ncbi:unnamed protein product, partial [Prorocentrum cordatum]
EPQQPLAPSWLGMAPGLRRARSLRSLPAWALGALLGQAARADDVLQLFGHTAALAATSRGKPLSRLAPIVDPTGDAAALCHDFECSGPQSACRDFPDRVCAWYAPCGHEDPPGLPAQAAAPREVSRRPAPAGSLRRGHAGRGHGHRRRGGQRALVDDVERLRHQREAVPISHVAVFGNALVQLFVNAPQRHPEMPQRPLIHHEMAWLMMPTMLGGNSLGIVVGKMLPPTLLVVLALVLLALTSAKTFAKGRAALRKRGPAARGEPSSGAGGGWPGAAAAGALVEGGRGPEGDWRTGTGVRPAW